MTEPRFCASCNGSWSFYDPEPFVEADGKHYHARCLRDLEMSEIVDALTPLQFEAILRRELEELSERARCRDSKDGQSSRQSQPPA